MKIGEQRQYSCTGTTGTVSWTTRDSGIASVDKTTGLVIGVAQGQTYLTANVDGVYITITIKVGAIEEGTYFIANRKSGLYMDLEAAAFDDGTPIQQWEFHGEIQSRWIITMESTGYYSIRSALTNKYIGVENSSTSGGAAIKQYSSIANQRGRQWSIIETPRGAYRFKPNTATHMGLSIPETNPYDNGTNLQQLGYANDLNFRDEWYVYAQKDYTLMYIGYNVGDPLMPPIVHEVDSALKTNANLDGYAFTSLTKNEALVYLSSSSVFSCITHGLQDRIAVTDGELTISDLDSIYDAAFDDLKFVYLGACLTGAGTTSGNNLVNKFYNKGADAVLGFTTEVFVSETNAWTKYFMHSLSQGETLAHALGMADYLLLNDPTVIVPEYTTAFEYRYFAGSYQLIPCS